MRYLPDHRWRAVPGVWLGGGRLDALVGRVSVVTTRHLTGASLVAGLVSLVGLIVGLADPAYYAPEDPIDYLAALLNTAGPVAAAAALAIWWRVTPVRRGAALVLLGAVAALVFGLGNFLEDIAGVEWGFALFGIGGMATVVTLGLGGLLALTVKDPWRWSGLFLIAVAAGPALDSGEVWVLAWLGFAVALQRGLFPAPVRAR